MDFSPGQPGADDFGCALLRGAARRGAYSPSRALDAAADAADGAQRRREPPRPGDAAAAARARRPRLPKHPARTK